MRWLEQIALKKTPSQPKKPAWYWPELLPDAVQRIMEGKQTLREIADAWGKSISPLKNQFTPSARKMDEDKFRALLGGAYPGLTLEEVRSQIRDNARLKQKTKEHSGKRIDWQSLLPRISQMVFEERKPLHQISKELGISQSWMSKVVKQTFANENNEHYRPDIYDVLNHNALAWNAFNKQREKGESFSQPQVPDKYRHIVEKARGLLRSGVRPDLVAAELSSMMRNEGELPLDQKITRQDIGRMVKTWYPTDSELHPLTIPVTKRKVKPRAGRSLPSTKMKQLKSLLRQSLATGKPTVFEIQDMMSVDQERIRGTAQQIFTPEQFEKWEEQQQFPWYSLDQTQLTEWETAPTKYSSIREWITKNCLMG